MVVRTLRWRLSTFLALGGALASLAMACGDDDAVTPTSGPDGSSPDGATSDVSNTDAAPPSDSAIDAFCKETLGLYAPKYAACCDPSEAPKQYAFNKTLLDGLLPACTMSLGKSLKAGRAALVPAATATCEMNVSAAINARACPDVLRSPSNQASKSIFNEAAGCSEMLVGRQAADAACSNDYECLDGLTCIGWTSTSDGTCKAPPGESALCGFAIPDGGGFVELVRWGFGTHPRCAPGFYCASSSLQQGTCRALTLASGSCTSNDGCADGLRCQLGVCGTAGPAPAGAPCERSTDCQDRLYCKSTDGGRVCAVRELAGQPCSGEFSAECQGACVKPDGGTASCVSACGSL